MPHINALITPSPMIAPPMTIGINAPSPPAELPSKNGVDSIP